MDTRFSLRIPGYPTPDHRLFYDSPVPLKPHHETHSHATLEFAGVPVPSTRLPSLTNALLLAMGHWLAPVVDEPDALATAIREEEEAIDHLRKRLEALER